MSTPFTDANAGYGFYVRKSAPVVFATLVRKLEESNNDLHRRAQIAESEIERAHFLLDDIGTPRLQDGGLPYSLEGRLRIMRPNAKLTGRPVSQTVNPSRPSAPVERTVMRRARSSEEHNMEYQANLIEEAARILGRAGGKVKSEKKTLAARENAKKRRLKIE